MDPKHVSLMTHAEVLRPMHDFLAINWATDRTCTTKVSTLQESRKYLRDNDDVYLLQL